MKNPSGEKEGFTITLTVRADGHKEPAVIVFKGKSTNGDLSERIRSKLKNRENVVVKCSSSAWWTRELDKWWIESTFPEGEQKKVLVRDQAPVHTVIENRFLLEDRNVEQVFVPAARTGDFQPLDVGINRPFKVKCREAYSRWRQNDPGVTKFGNIRKPNRQDFINFISEAWSEITPDVIRNSFRAARIISDEMDCQSLPPEELQSEEPDESSLDISAFSDSLLGEFDEIDSI